MEPETIEACPECESDQLVLEGRKIDGVFRRAIFCMACAYYVVEEIVLLLGA